MTGSRAVSEQPRVRRNEWHHLSVPALGAWEPTLSVSVVIPAYRAGRLLPTVLAGLAAQSYPAHLLEVVVADDGPDPLELPEVRPDRTRIVPITEGWGRANACHTGALASDGDVIHWLDADMLVEREHIEAQLRWHHLVDYATVLGDKWFVDPEPALAAGPVEIRDAVAAGRVADYFADQEQQPHDWVEAVYERTDDLRYAGPRALRTHVGATASLHRALYLDSGGMDTTLRLGEDIALGYRLAQEGAFFVPDREARSWHLGPSTVMGRRETVNAYNDPFLADRAPELRPKRRTGRTYTVPYLEVLLDTRGLEAPRVTAVVDAVLGSSLPDLVVTLVDDWSHLDDARRSPLDDPLLATRIVHETYRADGRVRLVEGLPTGPADTTFRLTLSGAQWAPRPRALADLTMHLERTHDGLRQVLMPDGSSARIERTAAYARARRLAREGEDLDDVVDEIAGSAWFEAGDAGFTDSAEIGRSAMPGTAGPPMTSDEAWSHIDKLHGRRERKTTRAPSADPVPPAAAETPTPSVRRRLGALLRRS